MLRILTLTSLCGLIGSIVINVALLTGHDGANTAGTVLFVTLFAVALPLIRRLAPYVAAQRGGRVLPALLVGAPAFMGPFVRVCFLYAAVSFGLGIAHILPLEPTHLGPVGTSYAIFAYAVLWAASVAATARGEQAITFQCIRGHPMPSGAKFCEACGEPAEPFRLRAKTDA